MNIQIRQTINNALNEALKKEIGGAMKDAAAGATNYVLEQFIGNILDEDTFRYYCDNICWDIELVVDNVMERVFDKPVDKEDEDND